MVRGVVMKVDATRTATSLLIGVMVIAVSGFATSPGLGTHPAQTGTGTDCVAHLTGDASGAFLATGGGVHVHDGTYLVTHGPSTFIAIDFFDTNGVWIGWRASTSGSVPAAAEIGVLCLQDPPPVPDLLVTWTFTN